MALPYALGVFDTGLPLGAADKLAYAALMIVDTHTWVTVSNGAVSEVIKIGVPDYLGTIPILQRGAVPVLFREGACVSYGWTDEAIADKYPESGLDFVDACGDPTWCGCDAIPKVWKLDQPISIVIPYSGSPTSHIVTAAVAGVTSSSTAEAVSLSGTPTVAGTYALAIKIAKGGLSRSMNCSVVVEDSASTSCGEFNVSP
jgi:hypothetical protein